MMIVDDIDWTMLLIVIAYFYLTVRSQRSLLRAPLECFGAAGLNARKLAAAHLGLRFSCRL